MSIDQAVVEIVAEVLNEDPYEMDYTHYLETDLGAEQDDLESIAAELSRRFDLDIEYGMLEGKTLGQIIDLIREDL